MRPSSQTLVVAGVAGLIVLGGSGEGASASLPESAFSIVLEPFTPIEGLDGEHLGTGGIAINNSGVWAVWGANQLGRYIFSSERVVLNSTDVLADTSGTPAKPGVIRDFALNNHGQLAWAATAGTALPTLWVEGEAVVSQQDAAPLPIPGGPYVHTAFDRVRFNDEGRALLSSRTQFTLFETNDTVSSYLKNSDGAWEQKLVAGYGVQISPTITMLGAELDTGNNPSVFGMNNKGDAIYKAEFLVQEGDDFTLTEGVMVNQSVIAMKGQPSPLADFNYKGYFNDRAYDVNDSGVPLYSAVVEHESISSLAFWALIRGDEVVARGDNLPFGTVGFANPPRWISIDEDGNFFWSMHNVLGPDGQSTFAVLMNNEIILQTNVTTIEGMTLLSYNLQQLALSDNGSWLIVHGILDDGGVNRPVVFTVAIPGPGVLVMAGVAAVFGGRGRRRGA